MKRPFHALLAASVAMAGVALAQTAPVAPADPAATRPPIPATPGRVLDLAWLGKLVRVADPQIAPNGRSLVAVVTHPDYENDLNVAELAQVDLTSGATRMLTQDRKSVAFPRWSPGGDRIAYLAADEDKRNQIFLLDPNDGSVTQLTRSPTSIQQFAWRPDGGALAFAAVDEAPKKTGADRFDDAFEVGDGSFLDKEKALPSHLWLVPAGGGEARRLTAGAWSLPVAFPPGPPASPIAFTPDGAKLIYVRLESTYSGDRRDSSLQALDLATGRSEPITRQTRYVSHPVPSPDGTRVAYLYPRDGVSRNYRDVHVVEGLAGKGEGENVTRLIDRNFYRALWMPDGQAILTGANDATTAGLWLQPLHGKAKRLALRDVTPSTGYWLDANVGPRGEIAFVGTEPNRPAEIYVLDKPTSKPRRISSFNDALHAVHFGRSEVLTWPSPDGPPRNWIENGILTYPPDYKPGRKLPLVLYIHGGPVSSSKDTFNVFAQLLAAQGWLVFEPNYRGSDDAGNEFAHAIIDDSGDGPGRDVLAGLEAVKARGIVDPENIAVTGWSYGGFMTTWLIGHASFWKAAVAGAPVTNLIDQYTLSDLNVGRADAIGGSPYTGDWMSHWVAQSPITYFDHMSTPTLILQDTGDYRVTITQGYQLFHALKDRGVETRFYAYPVGGHFPADPVRARDVYRRWIDWLDRFLPHG